MSPFAILLHLGSIIAIIKDVEQAIQDIVAHKLSKEDALQVLSDLKNLLGLINFPNVSPEQLLDAVKELEQAIEAL